MKKRFLIFLLFLLLVPIFVGAVSIEANDSTDLKNMISFALFWCGFSTIHHSTFLLYPLAKTISKENSKKIFLIFLLLRIFIVSFIIIYINYNFFIVDTVILFVGAFIGIPILSLIEKILSKNTSTGFKEDQSDYNLANRAVCPVCFKPIEENSEVCKECGHFLK